MHRIIIKEKTFGNSMNRDLIRKIVYAFMIIALVHVSIGLSLHFKWKSDWNACQELKASRGEFVEPYEIYGGMLGVFFDVSAWPVYSWANIYHFGTPFPPCVLSDE